jgi:outer membrane protein TolC
VVDDTSEAKLTGEAGRARPDVQAAQKRAEGGTLRAKQRWWDLLGPEVDAAERSYAIELARFDAGTGSGLEVIQSQNMKARAKLTFIEQILRFNAAQIELAAAIGHLSPELFVH